LSYGQCCSSPFFLGEHGVHFVCLNFKPNISRKRSSNDRPLTQTLERHNIAKTFHVAPGWFVFRSSPACSFGFRYMAQLVFFWVRHSPVAVLSARGYHEVLLVSTFYA
jgi:hypothetical protein